MVHKYQCTIHLLLFVPFLLLLTTIYLLFPSLVIVLRLNFSRLSGGSDDGFSQKGLIARASFPILLAAHVVLTDSTCKIFFGKCGANQPNYVG